jgi:peptidoglycan/xylan/chitin deacetylase (PgdA/CDA1 family)
MKTIAGAFLIVFIISCTSKSDTKDKNTKSIADTSSSQTVNKKIADAATIVSRKEVPVLCYHHIRNFKPGESERMKSYVVTPAAFAEQMKSLSDSGYRTILPDELYNYLAYGASIPEKSIIITFDDTREEHFTIAAVEMKKYNFKGVFFLMTIPIGRPRYMSKEQIKQLADEGHTIASHTWDHHKVSDYKDTDWDVQLKKPAEQIEAITGKPVTYFAYPFGIFNREAFPELKKRGYKAAFQLSAK